MALLRSLEYRFSVEFLLSCEVGFGSALSQLCCQRLYAECSAETTSWSRFPRSWRTTVLGVGRNRADVPHPARPPQVHIGAPVQCTGTVVHATLAVTGVDIDVLQKPRFHFGVRVQQYGGPVRDGVPVDDGAR